MVASLLASCTTFHPPSTTRHAASLTHFQFTGKIAIQTAETRESAMIHWVNKGADFQMTLYDITGMERFRLSYIDHHAIIKEANHPANTLSQLDQIWVKKLPYWVRGLPAPKWPILPVTAHTIHYMTVQHTILPQKIRITSTATPLTITLVIHQWQIYRSPLEMRRLILRAV